MGYKLRCFACIALGLLGLLLGSCRFFSVASPTLPIVCITFDDQHKNVFSHALPAMKQYAYRGTCFVNSAMLGHSNMLSWQELGSLCKDDDWEVGGHTLNHEDLVELSYTEAETAIQADHEALVARGLNPRAFALPRGECPQEYFPIITEVYEFIRCSQDIAMYAPLNTTALGYLPFQEGWSAQQMKQRIDRGIAAGESLIVLGFHRIEDTSPDYYDNCPIAEFNEILAYINRLGLEVLPLSEAVDKLND